MIDIAGNEQTKWKHHLIEAARKKHRLPASTHIVFRDHVFSLERDVSGASETVVDINQKSTDPVPGPFVVEAVATSSAIDLDNEVIVPDGAEKSYFFSKRTIYLNHNYNWPIGSLASTTKKRGQWICRFGFASTPLAQDTKTLVAEGVVRGVSIGFVATDYGAPTAEEVKTYGPHRSIVRKWLWLELSVTPMPCNPEAIIRLVQEKKIKQTTAAMLGVQAPRPTQYLIL